MCREPLPARWPPLCGVENLKEVGPVSSTISKDGNLPGL